MPAGEGGIRQSRGNQAGQDGRSDARTRSGGCLETTLLQAAGISASRPPAIHIDIDSDTPRLNRGTRSGPVRLVLHPSTVESGPRRATTNEGKLEQQVNCCINSRIVRRSISQAMRSLIIGPAHELLDTRHKNRTRQLSPLSIDVVRPRPITEHGLRVKMLISPEGNHQARHAGTRPGPRSTQGTMADHPATLR